MTGNVSTSAQDLIQGAALNINAFSPGQPMDGNISSTCMQVLNDLLDSLSTDQAFVYSQVENILAWTPGQYQYTLGNPVGGTFVGFMTAGSPVITGLSPVPSNITVNGDLTDLLNVMPTGATVISSSGGNNGVSTTFTAPPTGGSATLSGAWASPSGLYLIGFSDGEFRSGVFTNGNTSVTWAPNLSGSPTASILVNLNTITMSANATVTQIVADTFTYTTPGNLKMTRPARFRTGFTRITTGNAAGLDYWFEFVSLDRYNEIGYKGVPGPWPYLAAYQPTFPLGTLWVYPQPSLAGTVFLYTDMILTQFTNLTQSINLPQGYSRALKKLLALELCPVFGKTPSGQLITQAKEAKNLLKAQNASPSITLRYDSDLVYSRHADASWITDGGFR